MAEDTQAAEATPEALQAEQTGRQGRRGTRRRQVATTAGALASGFGVVPSGTYDTYRQMRKSPTIAIARIASMAPVRTAEWTVEAADGAPAAARDFIQTHFGKLWPRLIRDVLYALDYGWAPFEKIVEVGPDGLWRYRRIKHLAVDITERLEEEDGSFAGLKNGKAKLPAEKCFVFVNDDEAGFPHGVARHENCRVEWAAWRALLDRTGQYANKVAGVTPMVEYPEGESEDEQGAEQDNFVIAKRILAALGQGKGVTMPNVLARYAEDLARGGIDPSKLKAWQISFIESQQQHGGDLQTLLTHMEKLMVRGWLQPERAVTEARFGTKADAAVGADLALTVAELLFWDILRYANDYLVDPLLVWNWGAAAEGTVRLAPSDMDAGVRAYYREILKQVLVNPSNADLLMSMVELEKLLDVAGVPRREDADVNELAKQRADAAGASWEVVQGTEPAVGEEEPGAAETE